MSCMAIALRSFIQIQCFSSTSQMKYSKNSADDVIGVDILRNCGCYLLGLVHHFLNHLLHDLLPKLLL